MRTLILCVCMGMIGFSAHAGKPSKTEKAETEKPVKKKKVSKDEKAFNKALAGDDPMLKVLFGVGK